MVVSTTATFDLDVLDLIEEAYERAGVDARTGNDFRTARRSLNLLSAEWSNRGLNLWTVQEGSIALVSGTDDYVLPADTIDVIETILRVTSNGTNTDYSLTRIGVGDYANIPNKATTGRPLQVYVQRILAPALTIWPVPDQAYTLVYWYMRRMKDASTGTNTMDVPSRFIPALTAGLAFYVAQKRPEAAMRLPFLKQEYNEQFELASQEDRGREAFRMSPWIGRV